MADGGVYARTGGKWERVGSGGGSGGGIDVESERANQLLQGDGAAGWQPGMALEVVDAVPADDDAGYEIGDVVFVTGPGDGGNDYVSKSGGDTITASDASVVPLTLKSAPGSAGVSTLNITNSAGATRFCHEAESNRTFIGGTGVPQGANEAAGSLYVSKFIVSDGIGSHSGSGGAYQGHRINIDWTNNEAHLWVDTTNVAILANTSDYRVKRDVKGAPQAWDRVKAIRPVTFRWRDEGIFKDDGKTHEGFIAHELAEIIPSAVNYEKEAVTDDGDPQYQSINLREILPVLVKALQEAQDRIESLEARLERKAVDEAALESGKAKLLALGLTSEEVEAMTNV